MWKSSWHMSESSMHWNLTGSVELRGYTINILRKIKMDSFSIINEICPTIEPTIDLLSQRESKSELFVPNFLNIVADSINGTLQIVRNSKNFRRYSRHKKNSFFFLQWISYRKFTVTYNCCEGKNKKIISTKTNDCTQSN